MIPSMEHLVHAVQQRLFIELEASGRHVHLSKEAAQHLFGHELTPKRPLSQPGQFLSQERLTLLTDHGRLERVAVLGPERPECQVELSRTDCVALGISAPVRQSGNTADTPGLTLCSDEEVLHLDRGVIVAQRHIHMTPEDAARFGVKDGQVVHLRALTARPLIFDDVVVRVSDKFCTFAHLDYDEANACGFQPGDLGMLLCRKH